MQPAAALGQTVRVRRDAGDVLAGEAGPDDEVESDRHHLLAEGRIAESLANSEVEARQHELLGYLGI